VNRQQLLAAICRDEGLGPEVIDEPISLPRDHKLVTLRDAGTYITKLRKAEHAAREWQIAMKALILVATSGGPTMLARIGVMRALNRGIERQFIMSEENALGEAQAGTRPVTQRKLWLASPRISSFG